VNCQPPAKNGFDGSMRIRVVRSAVVQHAPLGHDDYGISMERH
jgi:hypothetical protein